MLRVSAKEAIPYLVSKWLHIQFLIDQEEMSKLLDDLGEVFLFSTLGVKPVHENKMTKEYFLSVYNRYIELLRSKVKPTDEEFRFGFTALITSSLETVQALDVGQGREIICPKLPSLQVQHHRFDYSLTDKKFRPMVFGKDTISWGLQISYPQLFQDPTSREISSALDAKNFVNAALFKKFQEWIRKNTAPTPFEVEGSVVRVPIRIGKNCLSWAKGHPELAAKSLQVKDLKAVGGTDEN
jgi:hypothetical protein